MSDMRLKHARMVAMEARPNTCDEYRRVLLATPPAQAQHRTASSFAAATRHRDSPCHPKDGGMRNLSVELDLGLTREIMEPTGRPLSQASAQQTVEYAMASLASSRAVTPALTNVGAHSRSVTPGLGMRAVQAGFDDAFGFEATGLEASCVVTPLMSASATPRAVTPALGTRATTPMLPPRPASSTPRATSKIDSRITALAQRYAKDASETNSPVHSAVPSRAATPAIGVRAVTPQTGDNVISLMPTPHACSTNLGGGRASTPSSSSRPGSRAYTSNAGAGILRATALPPSQPLPLRPQRCSDGAGGKSQAISLESSRQQRAARVRESFRRKREQIAARFELLGRVDAYFHDVTRRIPGHGNSFYNAMFARRDVRKKSPICSLVRKYEKAKLSSLPLFMHPASVDVHVPQDGGCARTSELLSALALINFRRWLCGIRELRICSLRQALADMVVQTLRQRELCKPSSKVGTHAQVRKYAESFIDFAKTNVGSVAVCEDLPSALGGVSRLLAGVAGGAAPPDPTPGAESGLKIAFGDSVITRARLLAEESFQHIRNEDACWAYRPLFEFSAGASAEATPSNLSDVSFRRAILDPRLQRTGIARRGCRTCIWTAPLIRDEPAEEPCYRSLENDFLDAENMLRKQTDKLQASETAVKFDAWRVAMKEKIASSKQARTTEASAWATGGQPKTGFKSAIMKARRKSNSIPVKKDNFDKLLFGASKMVAGSNHLADLKKRAGLDDDAGLEPEYSVEIPEMVCFPPPGFVPIEFMETPDMPWTISPDPSRFAPGMGCSVSVYRVRIDIKNAYAERISQIVPAGLRVDCGAQAQAGTSFCISFFLACGVRAGEQYEVELQGLRRRDGSSEESVLRYFVSFEGFRPSLSDISSLPKRVRNFQALMEGPGVWNSLGVVVSGEFDMNAGQGRSIVKGKSDTRKSRVTNQRRSLMHQLTMRTKYDEYRPPPIGVAKHPEAVKALNAPHGCIQAELATTNNYDIETEENEITVVLAIPPHIVVRPLLSAFVPSHSKWETVPNATWSTYVEQGSEASVDLSLDQDNQKLLTRRVLVRIMLACPCLYEMRIMWGILPKDSGVCASFSINAIASYEHPLTININALPSMRSLVPYLGHMSIRNFGYPRKHGLADHFGVTILGPMRYRLRQGFVNFAVYVKQHDVGNMVARSTETEALDSSVLEELQLCAENDDSAVASSHSSSIDAQGMSGQSRQKESSQLKSRECESDTSSSDEEDDRMKSKTSNAAQVEKPVDPQFVKAIPYFAQQLLQAHTAKCASSQIVIAAVVGIWRRVEILQCRTVPGASLPEDMRAELRNSSGSLVAKAVEQEVAQKWQAELHEGVLQVTEEDISQSVQLFAFQIGRASTASLVATSETAPITLSATPSSFDESNAPELGAFAAPARWCLAEYIVDGDELVGYDEEEMAMPKRAAMTEGEIYNQRMATILREISRSEEGKVLRTPEDERKMRELLFGYADSPSQAAATGQCDGWSSDEAS